MMLLLIHIYDTVYQELFFFQLYFSYSSGRERLLGGRLTGIVTVLMRRMRDLGLSI